MSKANKETERSEVSNTKNCSFSLTFFILMSSLYLILLCFLGAQIIYLWFYTDFFAYYIKVFQFLIPKKIYNWLLIDEFLHDQSNNGSYINYLYVKYVFTDSFIIKFFLKLFACIICLSTWVAIIISLIFGNLLYIGLVFVILRILDFILRFANK